MSSILENLKMSKPISGNSKFQLSMKLDPLRMSYVEAIVSSRIKEHKSDAVRFLIDLGWEAIVNDGDFDNLLLVQSEALDYYMDEENREAIQEYFEDLNN